MDWRHAHRTLPTLELLTTPAISCKRRPSVNRRNCSCCSLLQRGYDRYPRHTADSGLTRPPQKPGRTVRHGLTRQGAFVTKPTEGLFSLVGCAPARIRGFVNSIPACRFSISSGRHCDVSCTQSVQAPQGVDATVRAVDRDVPLRGGSSQSSGSGLARVGPRESRGRGSGFRVADKASREINAVGARPSEKRHLEKLEARFCPARRRAGPHRTRRRPEFPSWG